ncbi:MAG: two-CW domain-containing protein [Candidatus Thorarchaeota archaeon]
MNCWEYKKCGREVGGKNVSTLGVCPASTFTLSDGFLGGKNGGRACVYITGTFCSGTIQGTFKEKEKHCDQCEFYKYLRKEYRIQVSVIKFLRYVEETNPVVTHEDQKFLPQIK